MLSKTQKWMEVAKIFASNSSEKVLCPECENENLKVEDIILDENTMERIIYCPFCGAKNYMRKKIEK